MNNTHKTVASLLAVASTALQPALARPVAASAITQNDVDFRQDFSTFLAAGMKRYPTIPALSVAIARSDGPVLITTLGWADRKARRRANTATRFYIASSTKSFVGLAMVRLAEQRQIDLDWTLAQLAPEITFAPGIQPEHITLRHLLSHSHGLSGDALQFRLAYSGEWDRPTLWRLISTLRPNAKAPRGTFAYSNLGYNVAALLIERRLNRPWQRIVEQEVIVPLKLRDTAVRGVSRPADRALPYDGLKRLYLRKTDATMQSAGGMESSARDMARWISTNLAAARGGTDAFAAAMRTTHAPLATTTGDFGPFARTGYGFGWYTGSYQSSILYHSFGGFAGFRAHSSFQPDQNLGVAILSNDDGAGYWFVDVAAAYAYDWHRLGGKAARAAAETRLAALDRRMADSGKATPATAAMQLSLTPSAYGGRYCNSEWGTITIAVPNGEFELRMGVLHARASGDARDVVRAELIPGQRTRLAFTIDGQTVSALTAFGAPFARC